MFGFKKEFSFFRKKKHAWNLKNVSNLWLFQVLKVSRYSLVRNSWLVHWYAGASESLSSCVWLPATALIIGILHTALLVLGRPMWPFVCMSGCYLSQNAVDRSSPRRLYLQPTIKKSTMGLVASWVWTWN